MKIFLTILFILSLSSIMIPSSYGDSTANSAQTSVSQQVSEQWNQIKTATAAHVSSTTAQLGSRGFWSQTGNTIASYWHQLVSKAKGMFDSNQ